MENAFSYECEKQGLPVPMPDQINSSFIDRILDRVR